MKEMNKFKKIAFAVLSVCGGLSVTTLASAASQATFDAATNVLKIQGVSIPSSASKATVVSADLKLVSTSPALQLELVSTGGNQLTGEFAHYDADLGKVFIPSVQVGSDTFFAELELVAGSNPLRFNVSKLHSTNFDKCPSFAIRGASANSCALQGTISSDITLTNNITWILAGGVYIGGDNKTPATLTIEPGTRVAGQSGADFLYIRRGSKINAVGDRQHPIVFTGSADGTDKNIAPGAWGGLVMAGNAPVNGCNATVAVCEQFDEALTSPYGGNKADDNSGILKYAQIRYAGIQVRPDQELNGLTLLGVGAGTNLDFVEIYRGSDDGIEMFGGTVNFKHIASVGNSDDSVDWGGGWTGKAQFVLIKQVADDGDNGIEADNNDVDNNSLPRAKPILANFTAIGSGTKVGGNGALLRRGTGVNIYNSTFTGFAKTCLNIDSLATFTNAGTIGNLTGNLTISNSYVDCTKNFDDVSDVTKELFLVSAWFNAQAGNKAEKPAITGYLPTSTIAATGPAIVKDNFVAQVPYVGAFENANDDWTAGWTIGLK